VPSMKVTTNMRPKYPPWYKIILNE
jgi:hypothetical protein